jgi:hypothetical protein
MGWGVGGKKEGAAGTGQRSEGKRKCRVLPGKMIHRQSKREKWERGRKENKWKKGC